MKRCTILFAVALLAVFCSQVIGAESDKLAEENAQLRGRVDKLEQELAVIKEMLMQQAAATKQAQKPVKVEELTEGDIAKLSELLREKGDKKLVKSSLEIDLYGYIKADASYDNSRTTPGNYVKWVDSENTGNNDNEFNMTANQTRIGMNIKGLEDDGLLTSGRVEVDFYGNGTAENKSGILVRHVYMKLDWPEDNFSIIAGQTSDVISPLTPYTLNYSVAWWAGNIGYRRPQIRLTKGFSLSDKTDLKLEGAIARTIGRSSDLGDDDTTTNSESGEDAGYPSLQGRVSLTTPLLTKLPATVGVSGHYGREEYDITSSGGKNKKFESWSLNVDLHQPINDWLAFKSEGFVGENLNQYLGGIGQGVNMTTLSEIRTQGGWVAASITPQGKWKYNLGISMEDVKNGDLNAGDRSQNRSIFGNAIYSINKNTSVGFELSQWQTKRVGESDADDIRAQTSFIYKF
ncbi:MAG: hypothetical protein FVQ79_02600 [Planctomycetes bacterium]|nr:hypothetical protein [Planctomycetota bacterium]